MTHTPEESMKWQEEFNKLSPQEQAKVRAQQADEWESQKTSLAKVKTYAELDEVKQRFVNLLGEAGGKSYVESVVIAVSNNQALQRCSPKSIFVSAMRAASLKLSVDPSLRQAHLVPFGNEATLIVDYHGLLSLSVNTGYYEKAPYVSEVFEGEEVTTNRFTGEVEVKGEKASDNVIGWMAYFKAKNGSERWEYMTNEQIDAYAMKYSKGYGTPNKDGVLVNSRGKPTIWHTEKDKMRRKTVLRVLLTKWGNFSPDVKSIIQVDDPDNIIDATFEMPSDENIVIPEDDPDAKKHKRTTEENLSQLGY